MKDNNYPFYTGKYWDEKIRCPECGAIQLAEVEGSVPWNGYVWECGICGYIIMESEWDVVGERKQLNLRNHSRIEEEL